jgi:predicted Holliday junction resolvase-like endonuclease
METSFVVLLLVVSIVFTAFLVYFLMRQYARRLFKRWQREHAIIWQEEKQRACKEAVSQSRSVLGGRFTEQLAPYLSGFHYDPTEARFIGSPFDLIVFPGLASGNPREIVIIEVKSGRNCRLTPSEQRIRELVEAGMVRWELIEHQSQTEEPQ